MARVVDPSQPPDLAAPVMPVPPAPAPLVPPTDVAERRHQSLLEAFQHLLMAIFGIHQVIHAHAPKAPLGSARALANLTPWVVARRDYHYLRIHSTAGLVLTVDVGAGPMTLTLAAGWNNVDFPDGSRVTCPAGGNVYVELTDYLPPSQR